MVVVASAEETELSCSEIAERTVITKSGVTKILDRLEQRRLIRRLPFAGRREIFKAGAFLPRT